MSVDRVRFNAIKVDSFMIISFDSSASSNRPDLGLCQCARALLFVIQTLPGCHATPETTHAV